MAKKEMIAPLRERYREKAVSALIKEFGYRNTLQIPRLKKVVVNVGVGKAVTDMKFLQAATQELSLVTGQKPVVTKARRSIAGFKIREGMPIGCMVTLRGKRMYEFVERLIHLALPRIRDFRGLSQKAFDGHGNYSLGIKEQLIFPEIVYDKILETHGMDVTIVTSAISDREGNALLKHLGFPFRQS